ncbi:HARBI1 family protein [Thermoflexus hugenholtzii]
MGVRLYLSTAALAARFGVDQATVRRNGRRILAVLRQVPEGEMEGPDPPSRGKDLPEMRAPYPDWFAIWDGTEQPIQRPADPEGQRGFDSGQKKRHTVQNGLVVNEEGRIRAVTPSTSGSVHDRRPFRESGVLRRIPQEVGGMGDAGLDGLHQDLPLHSVATPHKARRHHPWTADQKLMNRELSRVRIVIEHVLAQIKPFRALSERFRHRLEIHDAIFILVAAIVNRRTQERWALENA